MLQVKSPQDFGAGVLFLIIGAAGLYLGSDLTFGSARNMGPGYFPSIISGLIMLIGAVVAVKALAVHGPSIERIQVKPILFLLLAIGAFGLFIATIGVVLSSILLVIFAAYARPWREVNIYETLVFAVGVSLFVVVVFVYGLGQPMPIWWSN
jgi:hypothetical protein